MDHLVFLAKDRASADFEIPHTAEAYDGGLLEEYGQRQGYKDLADVLKLAEISEQMFQALIQTWTYFGLIWQVFGDVVDPNALVTTGSRYAARVTSRSLLHYGARWLDDLREAESEIGLLKYEHVAYGVNFMTQLVNLVDYYCLSRMFDGASRTVLGSKLLLEFLLTLLG